uniref:Cytotoxic and regulatory T cell molecule n=1 Tax=Pseudonaja textilis TaxID=8673 RepID=A0A670Z766_PSETE
MGGHACILLERTQTRGLPGVTLYKSFSSLGIFAQVLMEHLCLEEGQNLDLHCVNSKGNTSALEWKDPSGFTIFFNHWHGRSKYQLLHYSNDSLSIRLSNVTRHDEGLFTCLYYSENIGTKLVNVTVWAPPSRPLLEDLRATVNQTEENIVLRCSTEGSWPAPQITWLLQNGMEIFGNTQHQLEEKRFHSISKLSIYAFPRGSVVSCVIYHKALGKRNLTVTLHLDHASKWREIEAKDGKTQMFSVPFSPPKTETNMIYRGFVEEQANILFPGLVSILLLALFIMVLLFVVKLWKAHRDWKKGKRGTKKNLIHIGNSFLFHPGAQKFLKSLYSTTSKFLAVLQDFENHS